MDVEIEYMSDVGAYVDVTDHLPLRHTIYSMDGLLIDNRNIIVNKKDNLSLRTVTKMFVDYIREMYMTTMHIEKDIVLGNGKEPLLIYPKYGTIYDVDGFIDEFIDIDDEKFIAFITAIYKVMFYEIIKMSQKEPYLSIGFKTYVRYIHIIWYLPPSSIRWYVNSLLEDADK